LSAANAAATGEMMSISAKDPADIETLIERLAELLGAVKPF
jgi:hypothetical protein